MGLLSLLGLGKKQEERQELPIPVNENRTYPDGPFTVHYQFKSNGVGDTWETNTRTMEGRVKSYGERSLNFPSQSIYRGSECRVGTVLVLDASHGVTTEVEFPAILDTKQLMDQNVKYTHSHEDYSESSGGGLVTDNYRIDILTGPEKGVFFERKVLS
jgi:hypothetical protein